jgi:hypothetical protein
LPENVSEKRPNFSKTYQKLSPTQNNICLFFSKIIEDLTIFSQLCLWL